jgi:hypothetical protein
MGGGSGGGAGARGPPPPTFRVGQAIQNALIISTHKGVQLQFCTLKCTNEHQSSSLVIPGSPCGREQPYRIHPVTPFGRAPGRCVNDSPSIWGGVELGGRVRYPVKLHCSRYNSFAGTEMLSLSVYEPIAIRILLGGPSPNLVEGIEL